MSKVATIWGYIWHDWLEPLGHCVMCLIEGHDMVDGDPNDPEVGPQPDVHCTKCGKEWRW